MKNWNLKKIFSGLLITVAVLATLTIFSQLGNPTGITKDTLIGLPYYDSVEAAKAGSPQSNATGVLGPLTADSLRYTKLDSIPGEENIVRVTFINVVDNTPQPDTVVYVLVPLELLQTSQVAVESTEPTALDKTWDFLRTIPFFFIVLWPALWFLMDIPYQRLKDIQVLEPIPFEVTNAPTRLTAEIKGGVAAMVSPEESDQIRKLLGVVGTNIPKITGRVYLERLPGLNETEKYEEAGEDKVREAVLALLENWLPSISGHTTFFNIDIALREWIPKLVTGPVFTEEGVELPQLDASDLSRRFGVRLTRVLLEDVGFSPDQKRVRDAPLTSGSQGNSIVSFAKSMGMPLDATTLPMLSKALAEQNTAQIGAVRIPDNFTITLAGTGSNKQSGDGKGIGRQILEQIGEQVVNGGKKSKKQEAVDEKK